MNKKFICFAFSIAIALFLGYSYFVLNYKMLYLSPEYPIWMHVKNVINSKTDDDIKLLVIGDSRAKAGFIPNENKGIKSFNLSLGGGTPVEGYFTLLKYLKRNKLPEKIVISYTAGHLSGGNLYWPKTVPFEFLADNEYQEIERLALQLNELPITASNQEFGDYKFPNKYRSQFRNGISERRWSKNKKILEECELSKGHHFFGTSSGSNRLNRLNRLNYEATSSKTEFNESKLQGYYLNKLLELARTNNIELYFYIMPFNQSSFEKANKPYLKSYTNYILNLSVKYKMTLCNVPFFMKNEYFGDPSHLFKGAKKSTLKINNCVMRTH